MAKRKNNVEVTETTGATVGYEAELWQMADALRGSMDAAEYKHVVLGLLFLKYISDAFEEQHASLVTNIKIGDREARSKNILGRVYEYFLSQFASAEGKKGGEFYTPRCVVKLLVEMLEPYRGRVYDPCCGSSGMFVQSVEFIRAHANGNGNGGRAKADISIFGQESNYTSWRLAKMNLAIRGIEGKIEHGDSFHSDRLPDLKFDFILANPPFNVSDWGAERLQGDKRWQYGAPPKGNANFAWVQHIVYHLAPAGVAGFVLADGSMSFNQSGEGEIRKHGHVLTPGRYVGAEAQEDDGEPFEEKVKRLAAQLREQQTEAKKLDTAIAENPKGLGFG